MMFCKPVIVSDHTGTAPFIRNGENGYVVKAGSAEELADAITHAYHNKEKLPDMGRRSRLIYEQNFTKEIFRQNIQKNMM